MKPYLKVFIPFILSLLMFDFPIYSYAVSWLGSFYIFYVTWIENGKNISNGYGIANRIMKPIFLLQAIFAGFMCCTSIFYFIDHLGYEYFEKIDQARFIINEQTYLLAKCQRLSLLAHIALVLGIFTNLKTTRISYSFTNSKINKDYLLLRITILFYLTAILFQFSKGFFQFSVYFNSMAIISSSALLLKGLKSKKWSLVLFGATIYGINFVNATLTGFKEHILTGVIILFALLLPYYKRTIILLSIPTIYILLYILPTYATVMRQESWFGNMTAQEARSEALETLLNDNDTENKIAETNWEFLTDRLSEIGMFTDFTSFVPQKREFYGWEILENSVLSLIPRVIYPEKPITEVIAMERVYEAGVIERGAIVSAKTRPVVDGYLSFGYWGVFFFLFALGYFIQLFCNTAERWFGGYEFGCIVMFNGCFQALWRGNNFEFMLNNMFYGFITMWLVFMVLRKMQILVSVRQ